MVSIMHTLAKFNMTKDGGSKPGYKWPVAVSRPIESPAENVWQVISMAGNLEPCHPFCAKNPVEKWPGEGSKDRIHYLSGWIYERVFVQWIEGVGYDLEIGRAGGGKSFVSWRIKPIDKRSASLNITVYPHLMQNITTAVRWLPHLFYIKPLLIRYLSSVTRGFEWYIDRGEPVPRNHFGAHPWFSAR
jgi:hypothetical protein